MALISELIRVDEEPSVRTSVSSDYCFNSSYFQIRTYKSGDTNREEGSKQNIQLNKDKAQELIEILQEFIS